MPIFLTAPRVVANNVSVAGTVIDGGFWLLLYKTIDNQSLKCRTPNNRLLDSPIQFMTTKFSYKSLILNVL